MEFLPKKGSKRVKSFESDVASQSTSDKSAAAETAPKAAKTPRR